MVPAIQIAILITMAATMMALTASEILFDGEHAREGLICISYHCATGTLAGERRSFAFCSL